jgi:4-amino-4-deoxychorismate lyase
MEKEISVLSQEEVFRRLRESPHAARSSYLAMYSSWLGGIVKDPQLMSVPIDDHIVHRGDGVFEAAKCIDGRIYGLDRHLDRLSLSAEKIGLQLPYSQVEIRRIIIETLKASGASTAMMRLYISRGPGGFTANPYESIGSQMYLVITPYKPVSAEKYERGVTVKISSIQVKEGFFSQVKSCNYLPNVLMKKESVDRGVDFTVNRETNGHLAESSTENFAIISRAGELLLPGFEKTLKGITAVRIMELAEALVRDGTLKAVRNAPITVENVLEAQEAMMIGTTLDCLPVTEFEGQKVGAGVVGPIAQSLLRLLREDMISGPLVIQL